MNSSKYTGMSNNYIDLERSKYLKIEDLPKIRQEYK